MENIVFFINVAAITITDLSFALAVGVTATLPGSGKTFAVALCEKLRRTHSICESSLALSIAVQIILLTFSMTDTYTGPAFFSAVSDVCFTTHAGRALVCSLLTVLSLKAVTWFYAKRNPFFYQITNAFLLAIFAATRAAYGHSASDGMFSFRECLQFFHLISVATWAGSVIVSAWIVVPAIDDLRDLHQFGERLSRIAFGAVIFVTFTGAYNSLRGLDYQPHNLNSTWGYTLTVKLVLVFTALALGYRNRTLLMSTKHALTSIQRAGFLNTLRIEASIIIAILIVSAALGSTNLPM